MDACMFHNNYVEFIFRLDNYNIFYFGFKLFKNNVISA